MANTYPQSLAPNTQYDGEFSDLDEPVSVTVNGLPAAASITVTPAGITVTIPASDVVCPDKGDGQIVVSDESGHTYKTKITPCEGDRKSESEGSKPKAERTDPGAKPHPEANP